MTSGLLERRSDQPGAAQRPDCSAQELLGHVCGRQNLPEEGRHPRPVRRVIKVVLGSSECISVDLRY